ASADGGNGRGRLRAYVAQQLLDAARARPDAAFPVVVEKRDGADAASAATLSGKQIVALSADSSVLAVTPDALVHATGLGLLNAQSWPDVTRISSLWGTPRSWTAPTIAVVDSGIDSRLPDFRSRVLAQVDFTGSAKNAANADGYGHGTFVAALAAGAGRGRTGPYPVHPIVSVH